MGADEIKRLRDSLGMTQEQLAQQIGVSWSTVNRWEHGKVQPSPMAVQLLKRLGMGGGR